MVNISIPLIAVRGTDEGPFKSIKLDRESRKYVHVRVKNVRIRYDNITGEKIRLDHVFPVT